MTIKGEETILPNGSMGKRASSPPAVKRQFIGIYVNFPASYF
jgi:hypothetical protein